MKSLKDYIYESMFDEENIENDVVDAEIINWITGICKSINASHLKISQKPNKDGKYVVDCNASIYIDVTSPITSLTNGIFVWGRVNGGFYCSYCNSLTSLAGAPKKVGGSFDCSRCHSLTSLAGAPEKVKKDFYCKNCESLTSLEGAPKTVFGYFDCRNCKNLTSLDGISKKIGKKIYCTGCAKKFTKKDIEKAQNS